MKPLDALARAVGIQESYTDIWGKEHSVPPRTKEAILAALGVEDMPHCPEIHVVQADMPCERIIHGQAVALPALPMGYHQREVDGQMVTVIAAPPRCWLPDALAAGRRIWGVSAQLYGLRSERNWGIGDFGDLRELAEHTGRLGADVLGINPLHAGYPSAPAQFSPYSPSNREFLNYLAIDVTQLEGCEADAAQLAALRAAPLVDYPAVAAVKKEALERCFAHADKAALAAYVEECGEPLRMQAVFDALSEHFADAGWYGEWPAPYGNPHSPEVEAFRREHAQRVEFYCWLQYVADRQLAQAQQRALDAGMALGLYRDLAVGSGLGGAETWRHPQRFVRGVSVGAPPDAYNRNGQNWGLPPFNPLAMRQEGMRPLIDLLRANMRHAGALRIDHAFGLSRLFWVPEGMRPTEGAYVTYPLEAMLAVLRVESHRNRCLVIGEDLGTFPPGYKEAAAASGVLSYRLLYFEREADGGFIQPEDYPALALASVSTHDLPTLEGWRTEWDIDTKEALGLYPEAGMVAEERSSRRQETAKLQEALRRQNLGSDMREAAQCYLARSPAMLVMVQLEDILGLREQANMPATIDEHPNWRRKMPQTVTEICRNSGFLAYLAPRMRQERARAMPAHPVATYRLQLHNGFKLYDAAKLAPYLASLGISHLYTSPITTARGGSLHGYDVTDHTRINPELGGEEGFCAFRAALCKTGLRHLLDCVPNHMGVDAANHWWQDVLAHGPDSAYAPCFDIEWSEKLLLPVLGKPYEEALHDGELEVVHERGRLWLGYYGHRFALTPASLGAAEQAMHDAAALPGLIARQHYRLAHWREAAEHLNYRRFFEINDLAGVRVEEPAVFHSVHALVFDLLDKGQLEGLRIDHIDGLADPAGYCHALQSRIGPNRYVVAEKILGEGEELPQDWPIAGTTGYDALNQINGLFVDPAQEAVFDRIYRDFTGNRQDFAHVLLEAKKQVLRESFGSELRALAAVAQRLCGQDAAALRPALAEVIARFPVYRSYATAANRSEQDAAYIARALAAADMDEAMRAALASLFTAGDAGFLRRFQQLTGPAMAKGLEDTSFYRYHRFIALNEVGGNPGRFGLGAEEFHRQNRERRAHWPHALLATATHDTKRGEDMRVRLAALTAMPQEWEQVIQQWRGFAPEGVEANDLYFLFQTLAGSWPPELMGTLLPQEPLQTYRDRLCAYVTKALREGKARSSWLAPDEAYERAVHATIDRLLHTPAFIDAALPFLHKLAVAGMRNALSQLALKLTLPGVPDIYQGTEFWDFSLVDPDNRRPVDYDLRIGHLAATEDWGTLLAHWPDGRIKQRLLATLLRHRQQNRALYALGSYEPLAAPPAVCAYMRRQGRQCLVAAVRHDGQEAAFSFTAPGFTEARCLLTGKSATVSGGGLLVESAAGMPLAVYEAVAQP